MAGTFVKAHTPTNSKAAGTTINLTLASAVPAGNTIIVGVTMDNSTATAPVVNSIAAQAGETATWTRLFGIDAPSATAGGSIRGEVWAIRTTVQWAAASYVVTLSASVGSKAVMPSEFSGVTVTQRSTAGTGSNVTGTSAVATTTGTAPAVGDLVIGFGANEVDTVPGADSDTLGGAWIDTLATGSGTTGGTANTNVFCRLQYKFTTASGAQSYQMSTATNDGVVGVTALIPLVSVQQDFDLRWNVGDAPPQFAGIGTQLQASTSTPQVPVPSGVGANDVIRIAMFIDGSATVTAVPSGFTQAPDSPVTFTPLGGGTHSQVVYWKRATSPDTGTYDFTLSAATYVNAAAERYTGCITTGDPWDVTVSLGENTANTVSPAVSDTTTGPNRLLVWSATNWSGGAWTEPATFTKRRDSGDRVMAVADKLQAAAGATGSVTGTCVGNDKRTAWLGALKPPVGGTTPVSQDFDLRWRVSTTVQSDQDLRWRVLNTVQQDGDLRWRVLSTVQSDSDLRWRVLNVVSQNVDLRWNVISSLTPVSQDFDLRWRVLNRVQQDADLRWRVLNTVQSDQDLRWRVLNTVTADNDLRWRVLNRVQQDADLRWRVLNNVAQNVDLRWRVLGSVLQDFDLRWTVVSSMVFVSQDFDLRWRVLNRVSSDQDLRWRVLSAVSQDADLRWRVLNRVNADHTLPWRVLAGVSRDFDLRWSVKQLAISDTQLLWVVQLADTPLPTDVVARLADTFSASGRDHFSAGTLLDRID